MCSGRTTYTDSVLRAAYDTTVGELKSWMDSRQPADWGHVVMEYERDHADADPVSLCWIDDGSLAYPGEPREIKGRPRAALVIDARGTVYFLFGGYFDWPGEPDLEIARPSA